MATPIPQNDAAFDLEEVLEATGGRVMGPLGERHQGLCGVSTDSRRLRRGEIFVALQGEQHDGHRYLAAAAEAEAGLAIVERDLEPPGGATTLVRVDDTWRALRQLAAHHLTRWRQHHGGRVLAVTGSAGKTTTKAAIGAILDQVAPRLAHVTAGNLNNLVGVPMTIFGLGAS
ncbi:MAG: Mur ligase family protein, partial [Planctomycetota bacterium]